MSDIGKKIDAVVSQDLARRLKQHGYKRQRRTFALKSEAYVRLINVQASQWNLGNWGRFTINLGIHFPQISELLGLPDQPNSFRVESCLLSERIGKLMPNPHDHWWEINRTTDLDHMAEEIGSTCERYGLSWLERLSDLEQARLWLVEYRRYFHASGISYYLGRQGEAADLLGKAIADITQVKDSQKGLNYDLSYLDQLRDNMLAWGKQHDLLVGRESEE